MPPESGSSLSVQSPQTPFSLFFFFLFWSQGLLLRLLAGAELGPGCHEDVVATSRE